MKFIIIIIFFLIQIGSVSASSAIYDLCPNTQAMSQVKNQEDLKGTICKLQNSYLENTAVMSLTNSVLQTLKDSNENSWKQNPQLNVSLQKLSQKLTEINQAKTASQSNSPLAIALDELNTKWGDIRVRTHPYNREEYVKDINKILMMTKTGKRVLECYQKAHGPLIVGETIDEISPELKKTGAMMAFELVPAKDDPDKFIKIVHFNYEAPPLSVLTTYAHEIQHGCNSDTQAILQNAYNKSSDKDLQERLTQIVQDNAVDEMRAYRVSVEMFKDLAEAKPDLVCNTYSVRSLFGKQIQNEAEYSVTIDEKFQNGTYPLHLISLYASVGIFPPEVVLKQNADGTYANALRPDLVEKLKKEKVYVAP